MKLPKPLIHAIALGLAVGATTSCSLLENTNDISPNGEEKANQVHDKENTCGNETVDYDCPACGMG